MAIDVRLHRIQLDPQYDQIYFNDYQQLYFRDELGNDKLITGDTGKQCNYCNTISKGENCKTCGAPRRGYG